MNVVQELLIKVSNDPEPLKCDKLGDGARVYGREVKTIAKFFQWTHPESLRPEKARNVRLNVNFILF